MNLNEDLTKFTKNCKHLASKSVSPKTVCKSCAIAWAVRYADKEQMLVNWEELDKYTLSGLNVLREIIDKEISDRATKGMCSSCKGKTPNGCNYCNNGGL